MILIIMVIYNFKKNTFSLFFNSFLSDCSYIVRIPPYHLSKKLRFPQGYISFPFLFNIYMTDQPSNSILQADFADNKVILTSNSNPNIISLDTLTHLNITYYPYIITV